MPLNKLSFLYILVKKIKLFWNNWDSSNLTHEEYSLWELLEAVQKTLLYNRDPWQSSSGTELFRSWWWWWLCSFLRDAITKYHKTGVLIVLEARSSKSNCLKGHPLFQNSRKEFPLTLASFLFPTPPLLLRFSHFLFSLNLFGLSEE